jgi:hypothetical protein
MDWRKRANIDVDVVQFMYGDKDNLGKYEEVLMWDIDKTYLDTKFETIRGLFKTIMEKPFQKQNVPGTSVLVRLLRTNFEEKYSGQRMPIFFITASPPQMERKVVRKLQLDGISPYGVFCKDNLKNLRPKRFWKLTQQVGYKIQALLLLRKMLHPNVKQILWGDDSESDAIVYCLYSDICSRRYQPDELRSILTSLRVVGEQLESIIWLQSQIPENDPVLRIYINQADDTDSEYYIKFGRRVMPTYNSFQTALDLFELKRFSAEQVVELGMDLRTNYGFTRDEIEKSMDDLIRRKILTAESLEVLAPLLSEKRIIHPTFIPTVTPINREKLKTDEKSLDPWVPDRIDYIHDYR